MVKLIYRVGATLASISLVVVLGLWFLGYFSAYSTRYQCDGELVRESDRPDFDKCRYRKSDSGVFVMQSAEAPVY